MVLVNLIPTTTPTRAEEMTRINAHRYSYGLHNQNPKNSCKTYTDIVLFSRLQPDSSAFKISGQLLFIHRVSENIAESLFQTLSNITQPFSCDIFYR